MSEETYPAISELTCGNVFCAMCINEKCTAPENMNLLCSPSQYVGECSVKKVGEELINKLKQTTLNHFCSMLRR